jgi:magnesium transporter
MVNTLYLPELREMLAADDSQELREFCAAIHPAGTADFMDGLTPEESWRVLQHADPAVRGEIFHYFDHDKQLAILSSQDRQEIAELVANLAADDRVDLLNELDPAIVQELLALTPSEVRRDILRLSAYPEGTAGAVMTTDIVKLSEALTVRQGLAEVSRQAEDVETIYYLYIVDESDRLRGLVSARQLVSAMGKPDTTLGELMETELVTVDADATQEEAAQKVARYDLLAIPVVDEQHRLLGIITYDDVIDVVREEATRDAQQSAAVAPLDSGYLTTGLLELGWKRGVWLALLFFGGLLTAAALRTYDERLVMWPWLIFFIPLVISSGGNSGNQSATLVITALTTGDIKMADWLRVVRREFVVGLMLGGLLGCCGLAVFWLMGPEPRTLQTAAVLPLTLVLVVLCGALTGSILPLIFQRLGLDPALMSNPFVAGIVDILGLLIYMNVALLLLSQVR